ncbi:MAG TPA: hypothetical protein EYP59_15530 [Thiotrichaceae bacterium]|nr:hypothetical protein [Thiotrichaceae bacterium]
MKNIRNKMVSMILFGAVFLASTYALAETHQFVQFKNPTGIEFLFANDGGDDNLYADDGTVHEDGTDHTDWATFLLKKK